MKWIAAASLALLSMTANAAFEKTDWNAVGDKLVTVDTETGLEWLNLSVTDDKSISMVKAELATTYSGWRLATNDEVTALMYGIYSSVSNMEFSFLDARGSGNYPLWIGANDFASLMSNGVNFTSYHTGLYFDENGVIRYAGSYLNEGGAYTATVGLANTAVFSETSTINLVGVGGVFLVRAGDAEPSTPAPVPAPLGLGLIGLLGFALASRRRLP